MFRRLFRGSPPLPVNVRLVHPDGRVIPLELCYLGRRQGLWCWEAVTQARIPLTDVPGWDLAFDQLPPCTSIELSVGLDA